MKKRFLVWMLILVCGFTGNALADDIVININQAPEVCAILKAIPTRAEACAVIPDEGIRIMTSSYLDLLSATWYITNDYLDVETQRCYRSVYCVTSIDGSLYVERYMRWELGTVEQYYANTTAEYVLDKYQNQWEIEFGPYYLWSLDKKMEFYEMYQCTPFGQSEQWGEPDKENVDEETAIREAQRVVETKGLPVEALGMHADARYIVKPDRGYWEIRYWAKIQIGNETFWELVCIVAQATDGRFYTNLGTGEALHDLVVYAEYVNGTN